MDSSGDNHEQQQQQHSECSCSDVHHKKNNKRHRSWSRSRLVMQEAVSLGFFLWSCCLIRSLGFVGSKGWIETPQENQNQEYFIRGDGRESRRRLQLRGDNSDHLSSDSHNIERKGRLLYIVTSMHEYDNGRRKTKLGFDRFTHTLVPILADSVQSIQATTGMHVDVYLITHYVVQEHRKKELVEALPKTNVGLEIWDDATPMGYNVLEEGNTGQIGPITRALARQHRFVIKDKIRDYDAFMQWEDDMWIKGAHVQHFLDVSDQLSKLARDAPRRLPSFLTLDEAYQRFYGPMTRQQLARMLPGFMRVEVQLETFAWKKPKDIKTRLPVLLNWQEGEDNDAKEKISLQRATSGIDPSICCHMNASMAQTLARADGVPLPLAPSADKLLFWETNLEALGLRKMPPPKASTAVNASSPVSSLDWVLLLAGNVEDIYEDINYLIGDYWAGRAWGGRPEQRPNRHEAQYLNNQGGWMGTRDQIWQWHTKQCPTGFLPPYRYSLGEEGDGLKHGTVEFWSGGVQLVGPHACNLQRIVTLDPAGFSHHLLYHVSNNKQFFGPVLDQMSGENMQQFWGQLNTLKHHAIRAMALENL